MIHQTNPKITELLRLRREEEPGDEYFENFLVEFRERRRRDELLEVSKLSFWQEFQAWFREATLAKWLYGAGAAYAGVTLALLMWPASPVQPRQLTTPAQISLELEELPMFQEEGLLGEPEVSPVPKEGF